MIADPPYAPLLTACPPEHSLDRRSDFDQRAPVSSPCLWVDEARLGGNTINAGDAALCAGLIHMEGDLDKTYQLT